MPTESITGNIRSQICDSYLTLADSLKKVGCKDVRVDLVVYNG